MAGSTARNYTAVVRREVLPDGDAGHTVHNMNSGLDTERRRTYRAAPALPNEKYGRREDLPVTHEAGVSAPSELVHLVAQACVRVESLREPVVSIVSAARRLQVHPNTIRNWIKSGLISAVSLPSRVRRIPESEVVRLESALFEVPSSFPADVVSAAPKTSYNSNDDRPEQYPTV
jgi:excisionase family DNA binding protein